MSSDYIYQQNRGRASALRKSILNVKAEFFMLVDSDDYFEKATSKGDKESSRFSSAVSNVTDTAFKPIARRLDAIASRGQETVNMFSESGRKRNRGNIEKATAELREKIDRDVGGRSNVTNRDSDVSDEYHGVEESKGSQTDDYEASQSQSSSSPASQATSENRKKIVKKAKKAKKGKKEKTKSQARSRYGDFSGAASSTGESLRDGASAIKKSSYESLYSAGRETAAYAVASKRRVGGALARKAVSGNDYLKGKVQSAHNMVGSKIGISPQYKKPTTTMDSSTSGIDSREVEDAKFDELQTDEDIQALDTSAAAQAPDTSAAAPAPDISAAAPASDIPAADSSTPISVSDTNTASSARTGTEDGARTTLRKTLESETAGLDGDEDKALSERDSLKAELANTTPEDKEGI